MKIKSTSSATERVYSLLTQIPRGRVVTYAALAHAAECKSPRAIGQILRRNPHAPAVPCHRVIRSDLTIGGYSGCVDGPEAARKIALLEREGVSFVGGRLLDENQVWQFPVSVADCGDG